MTERFVVVKCEDAARKLISKYGEIGVDYDHNAPLSITFDRVSVGTDGEMGDMPFWFAIDKDGHGGTEYSALLVEQTVERFGEAGVSYHEYAPLVLRNVTVAVGYDDECEYWFIQISAK